MTKTRSLTEQGVWLLAARVVGFVLNLALPFLLVRRLDTAEFGLYKQAFLVVVFVAAILPLGFSMSAFYYLPRESEKRRAQVINHILLFNTVVGLFALIGFVFAPQILGAVFRSEEMARLSPLIGVVVFFWTFSSFLETVAVANREPRLSTVFIICAQLTKTVLLTAAAVCFGTVTALVYAALFQSLLQTVILLIYLNHRFRGFWTAFDRATFWQQAVYALPLGFAGLLYLLQINLHNYFVSYRFGAAAFAIYSVGCFELPLVGILGEAVTSVLIPRMSELESQDNRRAMIELVAVAAERLALAYFPLAVFLFITAESFIVTLFTDKFAASANLLRINVLLMPFYVVTLDSIVRAYPDLGRFILQLRIVMLPFLVGALWFGINYLDLAGMVAIVIVINIVEKSITAARVWRKLGMRLTDLHLFKNTAKIAVAAAIAGTITFFVQQTLPANIIAIEARNFFADVCRQTIGRTFQLPIVPAHVVLIVCGTIFALVYTILIYATNAIPNEERRRLLNFARGIWSKLLRKPTATETIAPEA